MSQIMNGITENKHLYRIALFIIGAVTLVRVFVLVISPLELYPDEAQYWWWAQSPAFGYFSKPPMIAWIIWATTALLGNAEWAIRMAAPLLHGAASLVIFCIARRVFDPRIALWSAVAYLTTPGASYSSGLISTDVPLLLCWAVALYAFLRGLDELDWRWPVLCGVAVGLGLLSKYAMLYFLFGAAFAAIVSTRARALVLSLRGAAILLIALVLIAPNIFWNAAHGFPTVAHTEANADWGRARYNPLSALGFLFSQFGVFGPVLMLGLLVSLWRLARIARPEPQLVLAAFCAPPLALMLVQSFIVEANANWAATAFVAATPLAVETLARWWHARALWISFAINGVAMVALWIILVQPNAADRIGLGNAFKREQGWRALGERVTKDARLAPYDAIATNNRSVIAEILYYAQPRSVPVRMWDRDLRDDDHFQMTMRLTRPAPHVLLVVSPSDAPGIVATFDSTKLVDIVSVPIGGHRKRITELYDALDYRGPQPVP
jgi:4-amino-4-deoxy-L-arabinose transferase-like glycosyltransferase